MWTQAQIDYAAALIGRIDSGERGIFLESVNTEAQAEAKVFPGGVFYSCTAYKGLRIHVAFETDTDAFNEELAALVQSSLKKTNSTNCVIWLWNGNRKIIKYLKEAFHVTKRGSHYYASIEFIMRRENFRPAVNETLEIRPYEKKRLFTYLDMLDRSMTFVEPNGPQYRRDFFRHRKRFAELADNPAFYFEAFWKDGELIGLYWLKNAEVDTLAVADKQQRKGYGAIILTRAIEMAFQRTDKDYAYLYAVDWNEKGQSFYKKYGMEQRGHSYCLHIENYRE